MEKQFTYNKYTQKGQPPITLQDLFRAFDKVWAKEAVQKVEVEGYPDKGELKKIAKRKIMDEQKTILHNVNELQTFFQKEHLVKRQIVIHIDDLIVDLGGDEILKECYSNYYEPKPKTLFKYVPYEHACKSVKKKRFKCGTAKEYGFQDPRDSIALLDYEEKITEDDFYDYVLQEIASEALDEQDINLEDKRVSINNLIGKMYYIGCLSDDPDSKYLWDNYGTGGVCIEFDVSDMNVHKITYSDMPLKPKYIRDRFRKITDIAQTESSKNVKEEFADLMRLVGAMGLLNLYRKDWKYHLESEWRLLIEPDKLKIEGNKKFMQGRVLRVISDLPEEENVELEKYCKGNGIAFERRIC